MTEDARSPVDAQLEVIAIERERIAGELHDDSVQAMTAVSLQLQRLLARCENDDDYQMVAETRRLADAAIERLRHMLFVLHPSSLEDDGLVATLAVYLESFVEPDGIQWQVNGDRGIAAPLGASALAFRLARESISNAVRHASPSKINISVAETAHQLVVRVRDDGSGFDTHGQVPRAGHFGLTHCRSLAETAGGTFEVTSRPGEGTTVSITVPVTDLASSPTDVSS